MGDGGEEAGRAFDDEDAALRRIEEGGISLAAERRQQAAGTGRDAFASDLSVAGFALCHRLGLRPISQVMGSSIYQVGYQSGNWPMMMGGRVIAELDTLSEAWNEVRRRALNRLALEARAAEADAVVGVRVERGTHDWAQGAIEYVVTGTAVRRGKGGGRSPGPVLTELSVADYANLVRAGVEPAGIVAWTSVFFAAFETGWMMEPARMSAMANFEVPEFTQALYSARETVMARLGLQAQQLRATGIIGVNISHRAQRQQVGSANRSRGGLVLTFDAAGTAIREDGTGGTFVPKTILDLST